MDFCGIICEFNPFHNGHKYLINQAKTKTNAKIICLMSGDFVQRGDPAFEEKYIRAKNAINAGADAVFELPTIYACSNAENFAYGAIKILKALGAKHIAFGVENTSLDILEKIAKIKLNNSLEFQNCFKNEIENGINYNTALKRAIAKEISIDVTEILAKPNNILAIEYLTAIKKLDAKINPIAISRIDNGYNSELAKNEFISASAIREKIYNGEDVSRFIPETNIKNSFLTKQEKEKFDTLAIFNLRNSPAYSLEKCYDYNEGIEYRIKKFADNYSNLDELCGAVSTPRYRIPRVKKLAIYPLLNITKSLISLSKTTKPAVKVLAISKQNKNMLSEINKKHINLIITNKDYEKLSSAQKKIITIDLNASNIYNLAINKQNNNDKKVGTLFL